MGCQEGKSEVIAIPAKAGAQTLIGNKRDRQLIPVYCICPDFLKSFRSGIQFFQVIQMVVFFKALEDFIH
jgi:hypothetical protein